MPLGNKAKIAPSWRSGPHLICDSLVPPEKIPQIAPRVVHLFFVGPTVVTKRQTDTHKDHETWVTNNRLCLLSFVLLWPNNKSVCVQPRQLDLSTRHCLHLLLNAMLRRRCSWTPGALHCRSLSPACTALSSKPATCHMPLLWSNDGTDRRMDTRPLYRPCPHTMWPVAIREKLSQYVSFAFFQLVHLLLQSLSQSPCFLSPLLVSPHLCLHRPLALLFYLTRSRFTLKTLLLLTLTTHTLAAA